jgi:hypothetical protein
MAMVALTARTARLTAACLLLWAAAGCSSGSSTSSPAPSAGLPATSRPTRSATPTPAPSTSPRLLNWKSVSFPAGARAAKPWWGLTVPSGGYFGGCYVGLPLFAQMTLRYCTSPDGLNWTMSDDPLLNGIEPKAAAHGSAGYVMVGVETSQSRAAVFHSADAITWTRDSDADVPQADLTLTQPDGSKQHGLTPMYAVVAGPNGFVAAGWHMEWQMATNKPAALWHSADGISWTEESSPGGGYTNLWSVGRRYFLSGGQFESGVASFLLWVSDDGVTWRHATVASDAPQSQDIYAVTELWDGSLRAIGDPLSDPSGASNAGLAFSSTDGGASWTYAGTSTTSGPGTFSEIDGAVQEGSFLSFDKGATWQSVATTPNGPADFTQPWLPLGNAFLLATPDTTGIDLAGPNAEASLDAAPTIISIGTP